MKKFFLALLKGVHLAARAILAGCAALLFFTAILIILVKGEEDGDSQWVG